jgi:malonyl CoA-acyl carrier protein transacylase
MSRRSDPEAIRDALVRQAAAPVRWVEVMQAMGAGVTPRLRMRARQGACRD